MHARSILENLDPAQPYRYIFYCYKSSNPIERLSINIAVPYTIINIVNPGSSISRPRDLFTLLRVIFHRYSALKKHSIDYFVQFDFTLGLPKLENTETLLIAYDLIPLIFKQDYIPNPKQSLRTTRGSAAAKLRAVFRSVYYRWRYWLHYKNFQRADILLSISKSTANSLISILGVDKSKIITIPLAPVFSTTNPRRPQGLRLNSLPFIFYIGATDARKKVEDLINSYDSIRKVKNIALVLAGKEFADRQAIPSPVIQNALDVSPFSDDIHTLGFVSDAEKLWLYQNASVFVFPSLYEGFGLPVVEAIENGCPVVSYDNSSIPEVSNTETLLVKTGDVNALSGAIRIALEKEAPRSVQKNQHTWKDYMEQFYDLLDKEGTG